MQGRQVHALRACSLLAISPPEGTMPPPGGFPKDLASINLTGWASLIQDVSQGMKTIPSTLSMDVYLDLMMLLQLLEAATGMGYCQICCQPTPSCLCAGADELAPTEAWSRMMASIPVPGVAASSAGSTTSEASTVKAQELVVASPPPGLTPQDFSSWSLPVPGAPQTGGLPPPSSGGVSRQAEGPWDTATWAPILQFQAPRAPRGMLLVHQQRPHRPAAPYLLPALPTSHPVAPYQLPALPTSLPVAPYQLPVLPMSQPVAPCQLPMPPTSQAVAPHQPPTPQMSQPVAPPQRAPSQTSRPSTPYQQAVQLPTPAGRGLLAPPSHRAAAPTTGQTAQEHGRQPTRGRGLRHRSASHPGLGQGVITGAPSSSAQGSAQPPSGHHPRTSCFDPAVIAGNFYSSSWRKDLEHILKVYYKYSLRVPFEEAEWVRVRELFFDRFMTRKAEALRIKEEFLLDYMPFIAGEFHAVTGMHLHELANFTRWVKKGSYYHGLLVSRGQLEQIPHLIGEDLPKWPQLKPSESHQDTYDRAEVSAAGTNEPTARPEAASIQETPMEEPPLAEAPVPGPSCSSPPAPMETGRAGDGPSWAEQVEASAETEFQQTRPPKHPRSQSRRWEMAPSLPFPLQDLEGRHAAVMKLYDYTVEETPLQDAVAGDAIRHLHSHLLPREARSLRNQVVCMIAEYHLTSSARLSSTQPPILPEVAKPLLPSLASYVPNISFEGTRDVRIVDCAKTLWVAVWLQRLDMSVRGDEMALGTLDTSQHCLGCLLKLFLVPATHDLSFREVVVWCLYENRRDAQCQLDDLIMRRNRAHEELDGLMEAHREATGAAHKQAKRDMDLHCRDLETLRARISFVESRLQEGSPKRDDKDNSSHESAEAEMSPEARAEDAPAGDAPEDAPTGDAPAPVPGPPPREDHAMEVNEGDVGPPPTSPISRDDDDLLSGNVTAGVEAELAHLTVSSPSGQEAEGEEASCTEAPPLLEVV